MSRKDIRNNLHRNWVGGKWDEIGSLQLSFLREMGLQPEHKLLDIGCGSLRGGVQFVQYLNSSNYYGIDINSSLIDAGVIELKKIGVLNKKPNLLVNGNFEFTKFNVKFEFALAFSVFTHIYMNHISRCLAEVKKILLPHGVFYATFFQAPYSMYLAPLDHQHGGIKTYYDSDPFHYSFDELRFLAGNAGLEIELQDGWEHPRDQKMVRFTHKSNP